MDMNWGNTSISALKIDGKQIFSTDQLEEAGQNRRSSFNYFKDLSTPVEIQVIIENNTAPPTLRFSFLGSELPTHLLSNFEEREAHMMPKPYWFSGTSIWQTEVNLDGLVAANH